MVNHHNIPRLVAPAPPPPQPIPRSFPPIYQQHQHQHQQQQQQQFIQRVPPGMIQHRSSLPINSRPINPANVVNRMPIVRSQTPLPVNRNPIGQNAPSAQPAPTMQQNTTVISSNSQQP